MVAAREEQEKLRTMGRRYGVPFLPPRSLNCFYEWLTLKPIDKGIRRGVDRTPLDRNACGHCRFPHIRRPSKTSDDDSVVPLRSDVGTRVGAQPYGQSSTSAFDGSLVAALREVSDVGESAGFVVGSYSKQVFPFRNEGEARLGAQRRTWKVATKWRTGMEPAEWRLRRWAAVRRCSEGRGKN